MSTHLANVIQAFNGAANSYDHECWAQKKSGEILMDLLANYAHHSQRIIDLGCGTGIVTRELYATFPSNTFYAIDMADQLLAKAKLHLNGQNIHLAQCDFNQIEQLACSFDILFSNLALHWSENLGETLKTLTKNMHHDSILACSIPLAHTFHELEPYCSIHSFLTLENMRKLSNACGLTMVDGKTETIFQTFATPKKALASLKATGAHYVGNKKSQPSSMKALKPLLLSKNHFSLTYHVGFFILKIKET